MGCPIDTGHLGSVVGLRWDDYHGVVMELVAVLVVRQRERALAVRQLEWLSARRRMKQQKAEVWVMQRHHGKASGKRGCLRLLDVPCEEGEIGFGGRSG